MRGLNLLISLGGSSVRQRPGASGSEEMGRGELSRMGAGARHVTRVGHEVRQEE
jgi:hypothetical protein